MAAFAAGWLLLGFYPLALALQANRVTTLRQPLLWAWLAWTAWLAVACTRTLRPDSADHVASYLALCLTGCAGIAVLGARRPGVSAWNFVVVGLLAVLMLPILTGLGDLRLESAQVVFLAATLTIPLLNYLPTRMAPGVVLAAASCGVELLRLLNGTAPAWLGPLLLSFAPWAAWLSMAKRRRKPSEFDRLWLAYRDRFGFVWGQRMREQFNRAAHHAGWPVELRWSGLYPPADSAEMLATLRAVLKRFGPENEEQSSSSRTSNRE
jgi:hypothetical protein